MQLANLQFKVRFGFCHLLGNVRSSFQRSERLLGLGNVRVVSDCAGDDHGSLLLLVLLLACEGSAIPPLDGRCCRLELGHVGLDLLQHLLALLDVLFAAGADRRVAVRVNLVHLDDEPVDRVLEAEQVAHGEKSGLAGGCAGVLFLNVGDGLADIAELLQAGQNLLGRPHLRECLDGVQDNAACGLTLGGDLGSVVGSPCALDAGCGADKSAQLQGLQAAGALSLLLLLLLLGEGHGTRLLLLLLLTLLLHQKLLLLLSGKQVVGAAAAKQATTLTTQELLLAQQLLLFKQALLLKLATTQKPALTLLSGGGLLLAAAAPGIGAEWIATAAATNAATGAAEEG